eukprot:11222807-Lingulodinium_polyedra.AAC.1
MSMPAQTAGVPKTTRGGSRRAALAPWASTTMRIWSCFLATKKTPAEDRPRRLNGAKPRSANLEH